MNRRRQMAVGFFSVVIVLVIGLIVYLAQLTAGQKVTVLRVKAAVAPGTAMSSANVEPVQVAAQPGDFAFSTRPIDGSGYVFATSLAPGDIVRDDDLQRGDAEVNVVLSTVGNIPVQVGDYANIYVTPTCQNTSGGGSGGGSGGSSAPGSSGSGSSAPSCAAGGAQPFYLVSYAAQITAVGTNSLTFRVPARLSAEWAALSYDTSPSSAYQAFVGQTYRSVPPPLTVCNSSTSSDAVVALLEQSACSPSSSGSGSQPTPSSGQ
jgi:hypothetical protein